MGESRDDAGPPKARRAGTEPGLGPGSGHAAVAVDRRSHDALDADAPSAVDFDALHAALGDPLALDDLPHDDEHPAHSGQRTGLASLDPIEEDAPADDAADDGLEGHGAEERVGESSGASSATYSSSRPHTIPPSYSPNEDLNAPPVIVASEDTVPSLPPKMTAPLPPRPIDPRDVRLGGTPQSGVPFIGSIVPTLPPGGRPAGPPSSGSHATAAPAYTADQIFAAGANARNPQMTVRMPDRPVAPGVHQRRGKVETLVVRPRGPTAKQKLFAFMTMLLLVTACGIAIIIWRKPHWVGLDQSPLVTPSASSAPASPTAPH